MAAPAADRFLIYSPPAAAAYGEEKFKKKLSSCSVSCPCSLLVSDRDIQQTHTVAASSAPASGNMMARVDRLDLVVGYLEDMRNGGSARSSSTATTLSSSSPASTPRGPRCRPAEELLQETRAKGSLVDRIACLENRVLKMEDDHQMSFSRRSPTASSSSTAAAMAMEGMADSGSSRNKKKKKGIKSLVQSCVVKSGAAKLKTKD